MELSECEVSICRLSSLGVVQYMVVQMYTSWETELYGYLVTSCDYLSVTCGYWSRSTKNFFAMRYLVTGQLFCSTNQSQNKSNKSADCVSHECWWLHWHGHHKNMYLSISQHKNHYSVIIVPHGTSWLYSVATDPDTVHPFVILSSCVLMNHVNHLPPAAKFLCCKALAPTFRGVERDLNRPRCHPQSWIGTHK